MRIDFCILVATVPAKRVSAIVIVPRRRMLNQLFAGDTILYFKGESFMFPHVYHLISVLLIGLPVHLIKHVKRLVNRLVKGRALDRTPVSETIINTQAVEYRADVILTYFNTSLTYNTATSIRGGKILRG